MTTPKTRIPTEWLIRIICLLSSALMTGGTLYTTQYWAFLQDSPNRNEMKQEITNAVEKRPSKWEADKPSILLMIQNLETSQRRINETQDAFRELIQKQQILLTEIQTLLKKQNP